MPNSQGSTLSPSCSVASRACARTNVSCVASSALASSRNRSPRKRRTERACASYTVRKSSVTGGSVPGVAWSSSRVSSAISLTPECDAGCGLVSVFYGGDFDGRQRGEGGGGVEEQPRGGIRRELHLDQAVLMVVQ